MVEYHPRLWNPKGGKRIVHMDFIPAEIDENYRLDVEVVGDLAHTLWMLNERSERDGIDESSFDHEHAQGARRAMAEDLTRHAADDTEGLIRPQKAIWDARQVLGPSDILLPDVGAHKMWAARYYHCHEPNTYLISNGFCSMGFAFPGAIAAQLVHPDRRVLAICGDAGFLMNVQEMETARRLDADIAVMVWEDNDYGLISWKQRTSFGHKVDMTFGNPDWSQLAEGFGWKGHRCERSTELASPLSEPGPSLVSIPIDYREIQCRPRALSHRPPSLVSIPIDYGENDLLTERLGRIRLAI